MAERNLDDELGDSTGAAYGWHFVKLELADKVQHLVGLKAIDRS